MGIGAKRDAVLRSEEDSGFPLNQKFPLRFRSQTIYMIINKK